MKILALEFSSDQRSVAVLDSSRAGDPLAPLSMVAEVGQPRNTQAIRLVEEALRNMRMEREEIECLAVGLGPGSYAGIRAAISFAQGWQLARPVGLIGISSAESLAANAHSEGLLGRWSIVIDAQRNEFYLARYDLEPGGPRVAEPLRLAPLSEVQARANSGENLAGPQVSKWFPTARELFPSAASVARLAAARTDFVSGEKLEPIYLRETSFVKAPAPRLLPTSNP